MNSHAQEEDKESNNTARLDKYKDQLEDLKLKQVQSDQKHLKELKVETNTSEQLLKESKAREKQKQEQLAQLKDELAKEEALRAKTLSMMNERLTEIKNQLAQH